jgi:hypothetical protein
MLVLRVLVLRTRRKPKQRQPALARCQPEPTARTVTDDNNHGLGALAQANSVRAYPWRPHDISPQAGGVPIKDPFAPMVEDRDDDALAAWERLADLYLAITFVFGSPT